MIPAEEIAAFGPWGLVVFAILGVLTGRLMPRSVVQDLRTELDYERAYRREVEKAYRELVVESSRLSSAISVAAVTATAAVVASPEAPP